MWGVQLVAKSHSALAGRGMSWADKYWGATEDYLAFGHDARHYCIS